MGIKSIFNSGKNKEDFLEDNVDIKEIIKEIESKSKIMEIDFERRITFLEKEIDIIRSLLGKIKDEKGLKLLLTNSQDIRERLRSLEDLKYLEHLEIANVIDDVSILKEGFESLKKNYEIVVSSLEKIPELNEFALKFKDKYKEMDLKLKQLESQLIEMQDSYAKNKDVIKIKDHVTKMDAQLEGIMKDISDLSNSFKDALNIHEKISKMVEEKYEEFKEHMDKYDAYEKEINNLKDKMDKISETVLTFRKQNDERVIAIIEYSVRKYDKALNLLQYQIDSLRKTSDAGLKMEEYSVLKEKINEIKELKKELKTFLKKVASLSPEKIKTLNKLLHADSKRIAKFELELDEINKRLANLEMKIKGMEKNFEMLRESINSLHPIDATCLNKQLEEWNKKFEKQVLSMSKNTIKMLEDKLLKDKKEMKKFVKNTVKYEMDKVLEEELINSLKTQLLDEVLSLLGEHEIKEEEKMELLKEFEKHLSDRLDSMREGIITQIREELFSLNDVKESKEGEIILKGEMIDIKKKIYSLLHEQEEKIKKLEKKISLLEKENNVVKQPYIIE